MNSLHRAFFGVALKMLFAVFLIASTLSASAATSFVEMHRDGVAGITSLLSVTDVTVSADGNFVYSAAAGNASTISIFQRNAATGQLSFASSVTDSTVPDLLGAMSVAASKDNKHIYVASVFGGGNHDGSINAFSRDEVTGALTFVNSNTAGQSGMTVGAFASVIVSPDGKSVYGVSVIPSGLAVFTRDTTTGALTFAEQHLDGVNGNYLAQYANLSAGPGKNITLTRDGLYLYITSTTDNAVSLYSRDVNTGLLTLVTVYIDGSNGVDGILGASSIALSADEKNLYVSGRTENSIAIFSINPNNRTLTYVNKVTQGVSGVTSLSGVKSLAISPDGKYVYSTAILSDAVTAFDRDAVTGLLTVNTVLVDGVAGVDGLNGAAGISIDPLSRHLYVAGLYDNAVAVFSLPTPALVLATVQRATTIADPAITLDQQLEVYDSDSVDLASAVITITQGFIATDLLSITPQAGITPSYNANTGVLTLSGVASLANYKAMLRTLSYTAGADQSLSSGQSSVRKIDIVVSDGNNASVPAVFTVTVQQPNAFAVTFVDWDSSVLSAQQVSPAGAAVAPTSPTRTGYLFAGWDVTFNNITTTTTVTAQYTLNTYAVTFDLAGGTLTGGGALVQSVAHSQAAVAPVFSAPAGQTFIGWSGTFTQVTANATYTALYSINSYTVTFDLAGGVATGGGALVQTVAFGQAAVVPVFTVPTGRSFSGWSTTFDNIAATTTITAQYIYNNFSVTAVVSGGGSVSPSTQQVEYGSQAIFTLSLANADDTVSLSSNCNAFLSGNQLMTADITANCSIVVSVYPAVVIDKDSNSAVTVNSASRFTVSGGAGDKSLSEVTVMRSGEETLLEAEVGRALVTLKEDGSYLFSATRTGRYLLTFTDATSGESVRVSFDVLPYIAFTSSQQPVQQETATLVRVWLSDEPIEYPVRVSFVATGSNVAVEQFEITAADNLRHSYSVTATAPIASVRLVDTNIANALVGTPALHTLAVQQALPSLSLNVTATQNAQQANVVTATGGDVTLSVAELNNTAATYTWSADGLVLSSSGATATLNAATAAEGRHNVHVSATTPDGRIGQYDLTLRVIGTCPIADCTGAGASGIPASANAVAQTPNRLPICPNVNTSSRAEGCQAIGATALYAEVPNQYTLTLGDLSSDQSWGSGQFGLALNDQAKVDSGFTRYGIVLNFDVIGLENPGEAVPVAIPLPAGTSIPQNAVWRKLINNQWRDFVVDDVNNIHSALRDALGQCPGVSSSVWSNGLTEGHGCVRLTIKDGGPNDEDGVSNGVIRDPGVLAVAQPVVPPVTPPVTPPVKTIVVKSSGGGSIDGLGLLFLGFIALLRVRKFWSAVLVALLPALAMAEGVYIGVDGVAVETKTSNANVNRKLYEAGATGTAEVDNSSRSGWHIYAGYQLDNAIAVELGWLDAGNISTRFNDIPDATSEEQLATVAPHSGEGVELGLRWIITDSFEYFKPSLRAGVWQMKFKDRYFNGVSTVTIKEKDNVPFVGLDAQIPVTQQWSAKLGVSSYFADNYNITTANVGLMYRF